MDDATDYLQYLAYQLGNIVYTIFFHPLSNVPGPWYLATSRVPYIRHNLNGTLLPWMQELHEKYGAVVRYSPNEVGVRKRTLLAAFEAFWHYLSHTRDPPK